MSEPKLMMQLRGQIILSDSLPGGGLPLGVFLDEGPGDPSLKDSRPLLRQVETGRCFLGSGSPELKLSLAGIFAVERGWSY